MNKLQKYITKFNQKNDLVYIKKFLEHKYKILNGGVLDEDKIKLIDELQEDINKKCTRIYKLKHKPIEGPEKFEKIVYNNNFLIEIMNSLIFKKSKNETIKLITNKILELMIKQSISILKTNGFICEIVEKKGLNHELTYNLICNKHTILSSNSSIILIDIKMRDEIIFNYILYEYEKPEIKEYINRYINEHVKDMINKLIIKIKNINNNEILDIIQPHLLENIDIIVENFKKYLTHNIFVNYDDRINNYKEMIYKFSQMSSQKLVKEDGVFFSKEGAKIEEDIYSFLNKDNKYNNVLFKTIFNTSNCRSNIKGEFDLVIGDFDERVIDDSNKVYECYINKIYDIKKTARLINEDAEKFTNAINILNSSNVKLKKDNIEYTNIIPVENIYKGYIYVNDLSYNELRYEINVSISKFIHKLKSVNNIDGLLMIFSLFKMEDINGTLRPVILLDDIKSNYKDLYDFIKQKYDEINEKLEIISKEFEIYKCDPYTNKE